MTQILGTKRRNEYLSNLATFFSVPESIESQIFDTTMVKTRTGQLPVDNKSNARSLLGTARVGNDISIHQVNFEEISDVTFRINSHDVSALMRNELKENYGQTTLDKMYVNNVKRSAIITREIGLAGLVFDEANYSASNKFTPTTKHDDATGGDPFGDMETLRQMVRDGTMGRYPNSAIIGPALISNYMTNPKFIERISGVQTLLSQNVILELIKNHFGLQNVSIGSMRYNTAKEGQTISESDIWSDKIVFYFKSPLASGDPTFGQRMTLKSNYESFYEILKDQEAGNRAHIEFKADWDYQDIIINADSGAIMYDVLT